MNNCLVKDIQREDIESAFENGRFTMVYQPQVSLLNQNEIVGAEAFVRLNHPVYGTMMPATFLPLIEEMGLILDLTRHVLKCVTRDWLDWNLKGVDINVSVNIGLCFLQQTNAVAELGKILSESNIPKRKVTLGFSYCFSDQKLSEVIGKALLGLRMKGYRLAMIGYGSNKIEDTVFDRLPLDEIKLDRSITSDLLSSEEHQRCYKHALYLANRYGMLLVAAGLEDKSTSDWLANMGGDVAQGYYFGKPLSSGEFYQVHVNSGQRSVIEETKRRILIIEDDPDYQNLLTQSLSDFFTLDVVASIAQAAKRMELFAPDIILSDVNLPDGSGIAFCKAHVDTHSIKSPSIVFISGGQEFENKIQAYEAGASDFIQKPFSIVELVAKLKQLSNYQDRRQKLISDADQASLLVMQSLKETAYFGDIVQFLKRLLVCQDEAQISKELFTFMAQKSLYTCTEFRDGDSCMNFDQVAGTCSPIELNIFELLRDKGRLYPFGQRLLVNDVHVSFLVKNMPQDEEEKGKIRDYVAILVEGMEARYKELLRQRVMNNVTQKLEGLAHKLLSVVNSDQKRKNELLEKYSFELQMSFHTLDLDEMQERQITLIVDEMLKTKDSEEDNAQKISNEVASILEALKASLAGIDEKSEDNNDALQDSVELF